jgi:helicase
MQIIECGTLGGAADPTDEESPAWSDLGLDPTWSDIVASIQAETRPRPAQVEALGRLRVLGTRRNLIVSAPTNGGKSLVGLLVLLDAVRRGQRAVLLEPLRALARERFEEISALRTALESALGRSVEVRVSTGDVRLDDERLADPPPEAGELLIATPERFDAILRNPRYDRWVGSVGAVCVDEAHMISSARRGPTLEYVITSLLCMPSPPRMVLLSATLGDIERTRDWLAPCDAVLVRKRVPPLSVAVVKLDEMEVASDIVVSLAREALQDRTASLLVFVYTTRSSEQLAARLTREFGQLSGQDGARAYHAQLSATQRIAARAAFSSGASRCLVATTALGHGVNLPATHVIVRDTTFAGEGTLPCGDILQMLGRAGRGDRSGRATVVVRPQDAWDAEDLAHHLRTETLPPLVSHFERTAGRGRRAAMDISPTAVEAAPQVLAQLARHADAGRSSDELQTFFRRSLGGEAVSVHVEPALRWLGDPTRVLAYRDENGRHHPTVLGLRTSRHMLPLSLTAGVAQLIRDLMTLDPSDRLMTVWTPLDHLVLLELLTNRMTAFRPFSAGLADQVEGWLEASPSQVPVLFREWIAGGPGRSRAAEVLGSLGCGEATGPGNDDRAYRTAISALFRAIVLFERGRGLSVNDLERRWKVQNLAGVEERWRDERLWQLSGLSGLFDIRVFYYHLREVCDANAERVQQVKRALRRMETQVYGLQEHIKHCSPLGTVLRSLRSVGAPRNVSSIGTGSIRRLEEQGVRSLVELAGLGVDDLVGLGLRRDRASQLHAYMCRRGR